MRRTPVILRLDGKAFHTLTRGCEKPFDKNLNDCMHFASLEVMKEVQGSKCAYIQSDEISILIIDYEKFNTDAWFDYNIQKMVSISSSVCSVSFTEKFGKRAYFDSRVFNIPREEVCNYFIWRQTDWIRNSLQMLARVYYSAKQMKNKQTPDIHEMLHQKGVNWADLESRWKNGTFISKQDGTWSKDYEVIFKQDRDRIDKLLIPDEQ
jgi:tRNA(His) 5'-end guanylyltransferase